MHSVGIRSSPLSRAQFKEFQALVHLPLEPVLFDTAGDQDRTTSLRSLGKSDFFTKEIDQALLNRAIRIGLHSAKDLPDPLPEGLIIGAITEGVDRSDSLVLHTDNPKIIGTSSERREEAARLLYPKATFVDIRGTIEERIANAQCDGVVIAEAALIRLGLTHLKRVKLPGETTPLQGQLAAVIRDDDDEMKAHLASVDSRPMHRILYLGLKRKHFHFPVIRIEPRKFTVDTRPFTHILFTSQSLIPLIPVHDQMCIAIGKETAKALGRPCLIAEEETAEGVVELLKTLDDPYILYPHSSQSRPVISNYLKEAHIRHEELIAYDPIPQVPYAPPPLEPFDEIFFTSPSTVSAFFRIYKTFKTGKKSSMLGAITKESFQNARQ